MSCFQFSCMAALGYSCKSGGEGSRMDGNRAMQEQGVVMFRAGRQGRKRPIFGEIGGETLESQPGLGWKGP